MLRNVFRQKYGQNVAIQQGCIYQTAYPVQLKGKANTYFIYNFFFAFIISLSTDTQKLMRKKRSARERKPKKLRGSFEIVSNFSKLMIQMSYNRWKTADDLQLISFVRSLKYGLCRNTITNFGQLHFESSTRSQGKTQPDCATTNVWYFEQKRFYLHRYT